MSELLRKVRVWWFCGMGFHKASHSRWRDLDGTLTSHCLNCRKVLRMTDGSWR